MPQTHLFALYRHTINQLQVEPRRHRGAPLQRHRQWIRQLARLRQSQRVLRPDPKLIAPAGLQAAQHQLRKGAEHRGRADPVRRAHLPVLHVVADDGRAAVRGRALPAYADDVGLRVLLARHQDRLPGWRGQPLEPRHENKGAA